MEKRNTRRKTQEQFEKEVFNLVGDKYTVLGKYLNNKEKIKFRHNICNREFDMKASNFLHNGQRCPYCNSNFGKINLDIAKAEFLKKGLIILDDKYTNEITKMHYRCQKCGSEHYMTYADVASKNRNHGCAKCAGNKKLTFEEIKSNIEKNDGYTLISSEQDLRNVHSKLLIKHSCGIFYRNSYNNFRNGERCPVCTAKKSSKGLSKAVIKIIDYLINKGISFEIEKQFDDLKITSKKARYDFYFESCSLLIEYQGKQHFETKPSPRFTEQKLQKLRKSDELKKKYAADNGFNLEYINYNEDPIYALEQIILKYKL